MTREEFIEELDKLGFVRVFSIKGKSIEEPIMAFSVRLSNDILVIISKGNNKECKDIVNVVINGDSNSFQSVSFENTLYLLQSLCIVDVSSISAYFDKKKEEDMVNNPSHYGKGAYEAINVIEAWGANFNIGNSLKYLSRYRKKDPNAIIQDLEKAKWYIDREINNLKKIQQ